MHKKLRIAQLAPLWVRIPPQKYGGIESVVSCLTEELVRRGHEVTLFASGDSITKAQLQSVYPKSLYSDGVPWSNPDYTLLNASQVYNQANNFDIIHSHIDFYSLYFADLVKTPTLHTLHNPLPLLSTNPENLEESRKRVLKTYQHQNYISISNFQRKGLPSLNYIQTVYNGTIDQNKYEYNETPKDYLAWLGRICIPKGPKEAIQIAKATNKKLILAGKVDYYDQDYYHQEIKPHVDGKQIQYIGELDLKGKVKFLKNAEALLNPINWDEPFGLVMIEAMACGTPVIAYNRGSVKEIVDDKKTGFVLKHGDLKGMIAAVKYLDKIDDSESHNMRLACRNHVKEKFTIEKMVDSYEQAYYQLVS